MWAWRKVGGEEGGVDVGAAALTLTFALAEGASPPFSAGSSAPGAEEAALVDEMVSLSFTSLSGVNGECTNGVGVVTTCGSGGWGNVGRGEEIGRAHV